MSDRGILTHIEELVAEEHELLGKNGLSVGERDRLDALRLQLKPVLEICSASAGAGGTRATTRTRRTSATQRRWRRISRHPALTN